MVLTKIIILNEQNEQTETQSFDFELEFDKELSYVRIELEKKDKIKDELSFSQRFEDEYFEITRGNEGDFILDDIIEKGSNKLYLKQNTKPAYWKFLNKSHKLDRGWTISSKDLILADKQAFILQSASITQYNVKDVKNVNLLHEYWANDQLFFISDNNVQDFAGLSEMKSRDSSQDVYEKAWLQIDKLKPDKDFIEEVNKAIDEENIEKFKKIIEKYGQFIPTRIIFSGRISNTKKSLKYCRNWDCTEFQKPKSIFHFVDPILRDRIYSFFEKKILYSEIIPESINYDNVDGDYKIIKLPKIVLGFNSIECADCSIFATVVGNKNYYHCQILASSDNELRLMIQRLKPNDNKLLIGWMVVGYDTYLNSIFSNNKEIQNMQLNVLKRKHIPPNSPDSKTDNKKDNIFGLNIPNLDEYYCIGIPIININNLNDKKSLLIGHHFTSDYKELYTFAYSSKKEIEKLPKFSFDVLFIKNNSPPMTFSEKSDGGIIDIDKIDDEFKKILPKFISLCSDEHMKMNIFLEQQLNKIKVQSLNPSENSCDFKYSLFIPFQRYFFLFCTF